MSHGIPKAMSDKGFQLAGLKLNDRSIRSGEMVVMGPPYLQYLRVAAAVRLAGRVKRQRWRI